MSKKNVARCIVVLLVCCICCCLSNVFASEWTYKVKSNTNSKYSNKYVIIISHEGRSDISIFTDVTWADLGIKQNGPLSTSILEKIKTKNYDYYIERLDAILNTDDGNGKKIGYASDGKNIPEDHADYNTESFVKAKYLREEMLAYDCRKLQSIVKDHQKKKYTKYSSSMYSSTFTTFTNFPEEIIKEQEEKFDTILKSWNTFIGIMGLSKIDELLDASSNATSESDDNFIPELSGAENDEFFEDDSGSTDSSEENGGSVGQIGNRDHTATGSGDWWADARSFFVNSSKDVSGSENVNTFVTEISDMIFKIGNMIFMVVTSILGVKYIFGSAEGKSQIKDSLITLIVAALFFYGWEAIKNLLNIQGLLSSSEDMVSAASKIYNTVLFIVNLLAIAGIIWIGVKYMLSSAEGKSQIKTSWGPLILGIIMVYATLKFLTTIITVILGGS